MSNLNSKQQEAVLHLGSPLLVLAGAGTGKTKVLTEKIIYLINSYAANPYQILAVTFTNKAALEMKHRVASKIGDLSKNIWIGTFHSIASRILKRNPEIVGLKPDFSIIDSEDSLRLIKKILVDFDVDSKEFPAKTYQYQIERLKDKALLPSDLSSKSIEKLPKFLVIYKSYQDRLIALNSADFGDLLLYNIKIFLSSLEILQYYQNKFQHILVDEYQDTNSAQYQWLLFLAGDKQNICAVGDDDQSIYSWRGAEIANILRFEKDFLNTKIIRLEQNYRSTSNILKLASHLISHNKSRHGKTLWTDGEIGKRIQLTSFINDRTEARVTAEIIENLQLKEKISLSQIAILVRAGYQTRCFEEVFMANGLPYLIVGGLKFYDRREIKDAIAYLRIVQNFTNDLALERIINLPKRGVGEAVIKLLQKVAQDRKCSLFLAIKAAIGDFLIKGKARQALTDLIVNLEKWNKLASSASLVDLTKEILRNSGYIDMWKNEKTPDAQNRVENLQEFTSSLLDFENLTAFLEHVSLVNDEKRLDVSKDMVNIMTVHSAKGLEFDTVFIPGLEEGVFPSARSAAEPKGLEEERRLLYVAITRAKKMLYLSFAQNRFTFGQLQATTASSFLKEMPQIVFDEKSYDQNYQDNLAFEGDQKEEFTNRVFHQKFGYGTVLSVDGEKLKIRFDKGDIKTIMKSFVKFQ